MIDKDTYYGLLCKLEELEREVKWLKEDNQDLENCLDKLPDEIYNRYVAEIYE